MNPCISTLAVIHGDIARNCHKRLLEHSASMIALFRSSDAVPCLLHQEKELAATRYKPGMPQSGSTAHPPAGRGIASMPHRIAQSGLCGDTARLTEPSHPSSWPY